MGRQQTDRGRRQVEKGMLGKHGSKGNWPWEADTVLNLLQMGTTVIRDSSSDKSE